MNKSTYNCDLKEMNCEHEEIALYNTDNSYTLSVTNSSLPIIKYVHPIVEIDPGGYGEPVDILGTGDAGCRRSRITVNLEREEVFEITTQVKDCPTLEELQTPRIARMRSTYFQVQEYKNGLEQSHRSVMAPNVRDILNQWEESSK